MEQLLPCYVWVEIDIEKCVQDSIKIFCSTPKSATYRQFALPTKSALRPKLIHSYYSQDYHELPKTELVRWRYHISELVYDFGLYSLIEFSFCRHNSMTSKARVAIIFSSVDGTDSGGGAEDREVSTNIRRGSDRSEWAARSIVESKSDKTLQEHKTNDPHHWRPVRGWVSFGVFTHL